MTAAATPATGLMRQAGLVYVAYFLLALTSTGLRIVPLEVIATVLYGVLAVLLYRLFAPADPFVARAMLALALIGCAVQVVGQVGADAGVARLALVPFGLLLVVLGYLVARSVFAPRALGALLIVAGLGWPFVAIPGVPVWYAAIAVVLGIVAEGSFAIWLLVAGR